MAYISSFRQLDAWLLSMDLVDSVLTVTRGLPRVEFDLSRQINRAAYQNHVSIAMGSHAEVETQLEICFRNKYLEPSKCQQAIALLNRVGPLLERLHDSLD